MTDEKYPLVKAAGLKIFCMSMDWRIQTNTQVSVIPADHVEAWLEAAPVVYGHKMAGSTHEWIYGTAQNPEDAERKDTYTARLILIEPIRTETAEDLLREMVKAAQFGSRSELDAVADRAKRLLERGK